jgi:YD repeat-containing protein
MSQKRGFAHAARGKFVALRRPVSLESRIGGARNSTHIPSFAALCQPVKLGIAQFDVSLGPDGDRKIFSIMTWGDELRARSRAIAKNRPPRWPDGVRTWARAVPWHSRHRKSRKLRTTGSPWSLRNGSGSRLQLRLSCPDPLGNIRSINYDPAGNVISQVDPLGNRVTHVYDAQSRPIATVNAVGARTSMAYNAANLLTAVTNPLSNTTTQVFDSLQRLVAQTDPLGHSITFSYDAAGNRISWKNAVGAVATTIFDMAGRRTARVNALGNIVSIGYDNANRRVTTTNPVGAVRERGHS